jgi:hypothetical protein
MAYVSGHFNSFYSTVSGSAGASYVAMGSTESGFELIESYHEEAVVDDAFGMAQPDAIQQGKDCIVRLTYVEYDKIFNCGALYQQIAQGQINPNVGIPLSTLAGELALMPVTGTPAATQLGAGNAYVFYKAIIVSDISTLLSSKYRRGPITFRCFPDPTTGSSQGYAYKIVTAPSGVNGTNPVPPG